MTLLFQIEPSSGKPIYKQIIDQINRLVMSGFLKPGAEIPPVRQVASDLEVNPMTVSKAYSLLEATGVLERLRGKGMIVSRNQRSTNSLAKKLQQIHPSLLESATQAKQLALPKKAVLEAFNQLLEE